MDGPLMTADDCRAYHKLTPTRSETNQKICVAVTAAVMINTLICAFVVIYVSSTQAKVSLKCPCFAPVKMNMKMTTK